MTSELIEREVMDAVQLQAVLDSHKTGPQIMPGTFVEKNAGRDQAPAEGERREAAGGA
jgi:hypothetical protein